MMSMWPKPFAKPVAKEHARKREEEAKKTI
jgi:hypothetical protein